ncbi:DinB family protein [Streptomyces sp. NBC_00211]
MFVHPDQDTRTDGGFKGERAVLAGYLRDQRLTLELKCAGLDAEVMARRSVEPSNPSLLGLVRNLAGVEQYWFRQVMAGEDVRRCRWGRPGVLGARSGLSRVGEVGRNPGGGV